jgi:hypothetical protein
VAGKVPMVLTDGYGFLGLKLIPNAEATLKIANGRIQPVELELRGDNWQPINPRFTEDKLACKEADVA